jgi:photosystem II stability/assembly factor-like uncharacterized protein
MDGGKLMWLPAVLSLVVFASPDGRASSAAAPQSAVLSLRVVGDDIFLLTNQRGGLYRSIDRGDTWVNIGGGLPNSPGYFFEVDSAARLWVGTAAGLSMSSDRGESWEAKQPTGLQHIARNGRLMFLFWVDERIALARTWTEGLYRSDDAGETWSEVAPELKQLHVTTVAKASDRSLWAATFSGGVFRSRDLGLTWEPINDGLPRCAILSLTIGGDGDVWAGTYGGGVYRRRREGRWQAANEGLSPHAIVQALATDGDGRLFAGTYADGLFTRTVDAGSWRSNGDGATPDAVTTLLPLSDRLFVGTQDKGLFAVDANASSWNPVSLRTVVASLARLRDGRIVAALATGPIVVSSDAGHSWHAASDIPWRDSAVLSAVGETLFAGTREGLFVSTDGAATWRAVPLPDGPHDVAYLADAGEGTLLAGLAGEQASFGFLRSTDFGASWSWSSDTPRGGTPRLASSLSTDELQGARAPGQAGDRFQFCLTADPTGRVAMGTDRGLYHSDDRGRTWEFHFFANGAFHASFDRQGTLYVAGMNDLFCNKPDDVELTPLDIVAKKTVLSSYEQVFALPDGRLLATVPGTDLLTQQDDAKWIPRRLPGFGLGRLHCVLVVDALTLLAAGPNGLVVSRNGGETWTPAPIRLRTFERGEP